MQPRWRIPVIKGTVRKAEINVDNIKLPRSFLIT